MNDTKLNELFKEFRKKYPKMDYFTQEEIFQYMRMAFHVGYDIKLFKNGLKGVIRSDGVEYESLTEAQNKSKTGRSNIIRSIKTGWKAGGYNWKYK